MKNSTNTFLISVLKYCPPLERQIKKIYRKYRLKTELALIKGTHKNTNTGTSVIHFSMHKSATQYVKSILRSCANETAMTPVSIHDYSFNTNFPFLDTLSLEETKQYHHIFKPQGYVYTPFEGMIKGIPALEKYKIVLMVRDPRDMLVSEFYSAAFSHAVPDKNGDKYEAFMARREMLQTTSIDDYVLSQAEGLCNAFMGYEELLDSYDNVHLTTYEKMIVDFDQWFKDIIEHCSFDLSAEFIQSIINKNKQSKPQQEDVHRHVRKGIAGDYKEKLQPDTIDSLNVTFEPIFKKFFSSLTSSETEKGSVPFL